MAIKPNDGEVFIREVDEEFRRDRVNELLRRYWWAIVAAILLFIGAIGGWIWWQGRQQELAAEQGEALIGALDSLQAGNSKAALPKIDELAESGRDGYRAAASFTRANMQLQAGDRAAALATLAGIAGNEDFAAPYRQAALVRQTALEFDGLQPQAVIQRLGPLARPGEPWFGSAGEMVAIAYMKMNQHQRAGQMFQQIARDEGVPPAIRTRAVQMAGSLGFNALDESAASGGASQAAPGSAPATKEGSE